MNYVPLSITMAWGGKTGHYVSFEEFEDIRFRDVCQWFCLNQFGKIVHGYDQILDLPQHKGEFTKDVQSPLDERPH